MRISLAVLAAIAFAAIPIHALCAQHPKLPLGSITYFVATQREAVAVAPAVYATYIASCLNADAKTPSFDEAKRSAIYVCIVSPKVVAEMEHLKFLPDAFDRQKVTFARRPE